MNLKQIEKVLRSPSRLESQYPRHERKLVRTSQKVTSRIGGGALSALVAVVVLFGAAIALRAQVTPGAAPIAPQSPVASLTLGSSDSAEPTKRFVSQPPTAIPTAIALPACLPSNVSLSLNGWGAAGGTTYAVIRIDLIGRPCVLSAVPGASLAAANATSIVSATVATETGMVALNSSLLARVGWTSWCGAAPAKPIALNLVLSTQINSSVLLPPDFTAPCQGVPSQLSVDPLFAP